MSLVPATAGVLVLAAMMVMSPMALEEARERGVVPSDWPHPSDFGLPEPPTDPPLPYPSHHLQPGDAPFTFWCRPYSPCAEVVFHAPRGAHGIRITFDFDVGGGYGVTARGLRGVNTTDRPYLMETDAWGLTGYGFERGMYVTWEHVVPSGTARDWELIFGPMSGDRGGHVHIVAFEFF